MKAGWGRRVSVTSFYACLIIGFSTAAAGCDLDGAVNGLPQDAAGLSLGAKDQLSAYGLVIFSMDDGDRITIGSPPE